MQPWKGLRWLVCLSIHAFVSCQEFLLERFFCVTVFAQKVVLMVGWVCLLRCVALRARAKRAEGLSISLFQEPFSFVAFNDVGCLECKPLIFFLFLSSCADCRVSNAAPSSD